MASNDDNDPPPPGFPGWTSEDVIKAVNRGVRKALARHKERGESIVIWRDGKIVTLTADEIELGPEDEGEPQ